MARRKKPTKHRRRRRSLSAGGGVVRRSYRRVRAGVNGGSIMNAAKAALASGGGGALAVLVDRNLPASTGKIARLVIGLGTSAVIHHFGFTNVSSGFNGGLTALAFKNGLLADDAPFADENVLSDPNAPIYLSEEGRPYVMAEDGNTRWLSEGEVNALAEEGAFAEYDVS